MPLLSSRARHILQPLKPLTLSVGFSFIVPLRFFGTTSTAAKGDSIQCTRRLVRQPSPAASRESPYPVVFLRMRGVGLQGKEEDGDGEWVEWSSMFSEKGYTSVEIDITIPSTPSSASSSTADPSFDPEELSISPLVTQLSTEIRLLAIPFPPILIARGISTLLAQAYIEDHPSSGLVLLDPMPDQDPRSDQHGKEEKGGKRLTWPTFTFEPHFPILVMSDQASLRELSVSNRLVREHGILPKDGKEKKGWFGGRSGKGVEIEVMERVDEGSRIQVERWMDRQGY
ncbi:hypothetical protein I302_105536 [Kwoniella bestiolae CBS 10118]|uniref:Uncharacterized protein n=1 Tax=Kwoniella bestiolae CBS 10118 TaxID=1296100 RepID=A0A1B9FTE7_9TREE|nr:hypothetical protein I302_08819 [Kwoniella bestiolae CBS 10118]OCF22038.1 hypothetical protein I302_08819 [Kwoniella bestiolae CBS 10118]